LARLRRLDGALVANHAATLFVLLLLLAHSSTPVAASRSSLQEVTSGQGCSRPVLCSLRGFAFTVARAATVWSGPSGA
jgi:hypothetical protein